MEHKKGKTLLRIGGSENLVYVYFTHWVAFEEVSGPRVLFKSRQGNWGLLACGTTHGAPILLYSQNFGFFPHPHSDPNLDYVTHDSPVI